MLEAGSFLSPTCGIRGNGVHLELDRPNADPLSPEKSLASSPEGKIMNVISNLDCMLQSYNRAYSI